MRRDLYRKLVAWKSSSTRKPLLLNGARQVGKTWLLREFAREEFRDHVYLNFEEDPRLDGLFEENLSPGVVLKNLARYLGRDEFDADTLILLDEIQAADGAIHSLKYFQEQAPSIPVAAAGSLLGVKLSGTRSFPVGKVNLLDLHPLSFFEFLDAHREHGLRELVQQKDDFTPFPEPLHQRLVERLRMYTFVGGMPEAVACHVESGDLPAVRTIQNDLVRAYALDFAKYAAPTDIPKLSIIWESVPSQLSRENKKFMFSAIKKSARAREYENALTWLVDAGLLHKANRVAKIGVPLRSYARPEIFKVYALDVGLLCAMTRLTESVLVEGNRLFEEFHGALIENLVAQTLVASGEERLHYWAAAGGAAEVDFVCELDAQVFPLEVKAGVNPRSRSLRSYDERYSPPILSRASLLNLQEAGRIRNYPLYAVGMFPAWSRRR